MNGSTESSGRPRCVECSVERLWPGATWTSQPLADGMTNRNYKVTVTPRDELPRVVVVQEQLPVELARSIGILRSSQLEIWPLAHEWGLAPELIAAFDDLGTVVMDFVEGTRMSDFDDRDLSITLTARAIAVLHQHTRSRTLEGLVSDPFTGTRWMFDQIRTHAPSKAAEFGWAMSLVERIRVARGPYEPCLLHGDVSDLNVFIAPSRDHAVLIDWEFIGPGDRYLELAFFCERGLLNPAEEELLLLSYEGTLDPRSRAIVQTYRFVSMLRDGLWAVRAGMLGFLDFDHRTYEDFCINRMRTIERGDAFAEALETLEARPSGPSGQTS